MDKEVSNTQKVMKGISSQTIVTIVLGVVEIVTFSIMSRLLTKEDFGYYAAITAITAVFATFSDTGIGSSIVQQKNINKRYVDNAFTLSLIFGLFISLLLFSLSGVLSRSVADVSMKVPLMLMSITLLLHCLTSVNFSLMHRKLQFFRIGSIKLVSLVITMSIAIWLAYRGFGYYAIITKAVLDSLLRYLLSLVLCRTRFGIALNGSTIKKIFSFSGWLMASSLFRNLSHQIDKLLMPRLLSVNALGSYNRPKEFVEQISSNLNGIFDSALFPVLSGIQDDIPRLNSAFKRSVYYMNIFAMFLTLLFVFNSSLLIRIFFGAQWLNLKFVMMVSSCTILFNIDGRLADCYLRSLGMTKQQFFFRIFEFVLKTLGVLIGYHWGIIGVAFSVVITNTIAKTIKIGYIGNRIEVTVKECFSIIFSSWRFAITLIPICLLALYLLPQGWIGDIALAGIFSISTFIIFLFIPRIVGGLYYKEGFVKIKSFITLKLCNKNTNNNLNNLV
jgi:PST family polysaccharide transporter